MCYCAVYSLPRFVFSFHIPQVFPSPPPFLSLLSSPSMLLSPPFSLMLLTENPEISPEKRSRANEGGKESKEGRRREEKGGGGWSGGTPPFPRAIQMMRSLYGWLPDCLERSRTSIIIYKPSTIHNPQSAIRNPQS